MYLLLLPLLVASLGEPASVDTHIRRVTVYSDRARITRTGSLTVPEGRNRVVVPGLPAALLDDSVSASLLASPLGGKARILSIEVEQEFGKHVDDARAKALLEQQKTLERKDRSLGDELSALSAEETFLRGLSVRPRTDEKGKPVALVLDPVSWRETLGFVGSGLESTLSRIRAKQKERGDLAKERAKLQLEIDKVASYKKEASKGIALELEGGGALTLEVTYILPGPSWRPAYDVRVLSSEGAVELVTHGIVRQETGEDWKDIELTLSTAMPQHGAELPELLAWRLGDAEQYAFATANGEVAAKADRGGLFHPHKSVASAPRHEPSAPPPPPASQPVTSDAEEVITVDGAPGVATTTTSRDDFGDVPSLAKAPERKAEDEKDAMTVTEAAPTVDTSKVVGGDLLKQSDLGVTGGNYQITLDGRAQAPAPVDIRQVAPNLWSLPAGHAFTFLSGGERPFSWQGDVLYCPSPTASAGGFDYGYQPERKVTVLSDGRERKLSLASGKLPAELEYEVVAPLSTKAYLRARVANDTRRPLLAGESFVFLDEDFVGRAFLGTVAPTEKVDLSLGVDDEVKVERRVEQSGETKGILSKKEKTAYQVKLTVKSFKKRPVTVLLRDQAPISWQKDDITVSGVTATPSPWTLKAADGSFVDGTHEEGGLYAWKLTVPPGEKSEARLSWSVEHPRDFDLIERRLP